jgi:hypothetical protein
LPLRIHKTLLLAAVLLAQTHDVMAQYPPGQRPPFELNLLLSSTADSPFRPVTVVSSRWDFLKSTGHK